MRIAIANSYRGADRPTEPPTSVYLFRCNPGRWNGPTPLTASPSSQATGRSMTMNTWLSFLKLESECFWNVRLRRRHLQQCPRLLGYTAVAEEDTYQKARQTLHLDSKIMSLWHTRLYCRRIRCRLSTNVQQKRRQKSLERPAPKPSRQTRPKPPGICIVNNALW